MLVIFCVEAMVKDEWKGKVRDIKEAIQKSNSKDKREIIDSIEGFATDIRTLIEEQQMPGFEGNKDIPLNINISPQPKPN